MVYISIFKLRVPTNVIVWAGSIDKTFPKTAFHRSPSYILAIRKAKNIHFEKKISEVLLIHLPMCSVRNLQRYKDKDDQIKFYPQS